MSEMKHTPGPWTTHPSFPWIVVPLADRDKKIGGAADPDREAELYAKQIVAYWEATRPDKPYDYASYFRTRVQPEEAVANARLIAAAPKLLAVCERALHHMLLRGWAVQVDHECREVYDEMKEAIAEASGTRKEE